MFWLAQHEFLEATILYQGIVITSYSIHYTKLYEEEIEIINPAVAAMRRRGFNVHGAVPADTVFHQALAGDYDAVVAMYHDQGLAPLKMLGFDEGVNLTLGLPIIRTSPDHGTAFGIAGRNVASGKSMRNAP